MTTGQRVGKRLQELREMAGLNQWDVADFLECDRSLISMIEHGRHSLSPADLQRLETHLEAKARKRYSTMFPAAELQETTA